MLRELRRELAKDTLYIVGGVYAVLDAVSSYVVDLFKRKD